MHISSDKVSAVVITFELFLKESGVQKALMMSFTSAFTCISLTFVELHCKRTVGMHVLFAPRHFKRLL